MFILIFMPVLSSVNTIRPVTAVYAQDELYMLHSTRWLGHNNNCPSQFPAKKQFLVNFPYYIINYLD